MMLVNKKDIKIFNGKVASWVLIFFLICSFFSVSSAYSKVIKKSFKNKLNSNNAPIRIKSNKMIVLDKKNEVVFTGNVIATQGNMTIEADSLTVIYQKKGKTKTSKINNITKTRTIKEILAKGNVKITNKSITAFSNYAIFIKDKNIIILKGKPLIIKNNNRITGDTITIYLNQNKSIVTANKGHRVEAIIYPHEIK